MSFNPCAGIASSCLCSHVRLYSCFFSSLFLSIPFFFSCYFSSFSSLCSSLFSYSFSSVFLMVVFFFFFFFFFFFLMLRLHVALLVVVAVVVVAAIICTHLPSSSFHENHTVSFHKRTGRWFTVSTHLKNMLVKFDHFPRVSGESKKWLKPPPKYWLTSYLNGVISTL